MSLIRRLLALGAALGASGVAAQNSSSNSSDSASSSSSGSTPCVANATANITCPPPSSSGGTSPTASAASTTTASNSNSTTSEAPAATTSTTDSKSAATTSTAGNGTATTQAAGATIKQIESAVDVVNKLNATKFCAPYEGKTADGNKILQAFGLNKALIVLHLAAKKVVGQATTTGTITFDTVVRNDDGNGGNPLMNCQTTPALVVKTTQAAIDEQIKASWYNTKSCKEITHADCTAGTAPTRRQLTALPATFTTKTKALTYAKGSAEDFAAVATYAKATTAADWSTAVKNSVADATTAIANDNIPGMAGGTFLTAMKGADFTGTFDLDSANTDPNVGPDKDDLSVTTDPVHTEKTAPAATTSTSSAHLAKALAPLALLASLLALA